MMVIEIKTESAVTTIMISRFVQINEDFRMAESATSSVAGNNALRTRDGWNLGDKIDSMPELNQQGEYMNTTFGGCVVNIRARLGRIVFN